MPETYVALLRGINVGGKNKLPMKDLVRMFVDAGCENARSFIQSGNVIFHVAHAGAVQLPDIITAGIAREFGYQAPVLLRSTEQLKDVISHNPFLQEGASENALHVMFLADQPTAARVAGLDPNRSPPDSFRVRGQEVYLHLPAGVANSKLTNSYFDSKLATVSTGRNWRTVTKLLELMETDSV